MTMSSPHAKLPTAMRRASRITSRAVEGTERAAPRSRGSVLAPIATSHPSRANCRAIALPIPALPPVTIAFLPKS